MSTVARNPWTAEEPVRLPAGRRYEIDEGELVIVAPGCFEHGRMLSRIGAVLRAIARGNRLLGELVRGDVGILRSRGPNTLTAPDVAFYCRVEIHDPTEPDLTGRAQGEQPRTWLLAPSALVGEAVLPGLRYHLREVFGD